MVVIFFVLESWIWEIFVEGDAIFSSINECYYLACACVCVCVRAREKKLKGDYGSLSFILVIRFA